MHWIRHYKIMGGFFQWLIGRIIRRLHMAVHLAHTAECANPLAMLAFNTEAAHSRAFVGSADIDYKVHGCSKTFAFIYL